MQRAAALARGARPPRSRAPERTVRRPLEPRLRRERRPSLWASRDHRVHRHVGSRHRGALQRRRQLHREPPLRGDVLQQSHGRRRRLSPGRRRLHDDDVRRRERPAQLVTSARVPKTHRVSPFDDPSRLIERDLTALAREGKIPVAYGVDSVVGEIEALLSQGGKHPHLVGDLGVGKTALVQEIARRVIDGRAPRALSSWRIVEVALSSISSRATNEKQSNELLEALLDSLAEPKGSHTLVFLRDLELVGGNLFASVLLSSLRAGNHRFLLESDAATANALRSTTPALAEHIHVLHVEEPSEDAMRLLLSRVSHDLETESLRVDESAGTMALRLTTKFLLAQRHPRKSVELLREAAAQVTALAGRFVGGDEVMRRFCEATRLPKLLVDDRVPLDLAALEKHFADRILGQQDAVSAVLRSVALLKAGLNDPRRPLGVFLFAGPTGVGKTHLAKLLAEYLFGSADRMVRVNMSDYPDDGDETVLFGSPWGHGRDARRGELTRLLDGKAFAVLLLDEFEKAGKSCHDRFLQLFDEGKFINALGETVPCSNVLIAATSNAGAEVYREPPLGFSPDRSAEELLAEVERRISALFRPELLNRFDAVCHFHPLGRVEIRKIALREVGRVLERDGIRARSLDVDIEPDVIDVLVEKGYSPIFGARYLQREIEKTLTSALAVEITRQPLPPGTHVRVLARGHGRVAALADPATGVTPTEPVVMPTVGAEVAHRRRDARGLVDDAMKLGARAADITRAAELEALSARRTEMLAETQAPTFWDDPPRAAATLRAYRALDAQVAELAKLGACCAAALHRARGALTDPSVLVAAARAVELAAREVQLAEARVATGTLATVDEVLVEITGSGSDAPQREWVDTLVRMYLGWAERRGYEASAIAESHDPHCVVLRVSGPGVYGFLAAERGTHRRTTDRRAPSTDPGTDAARIAASVRVHRADGEGPALLGIVAQPVKRKAGAFVPRIASSALARSESTGHVLRLEGSGDPDDLRDVAARLLAGRGQSLDESRRYHTGRAALVEDPRTGERTPRVKDVLRGEIDSFIAAWIARMLGDRIDPANSSKSDRF
ncbi:MAG: AAA family ATPase [Deltaproteobacteria bacterium]|nr:AAA family ATPase [Deltaproteobacteria bacterium]